MELIKNKKKIIRPENHFRTDLILLILDSEIKNILENNPNIFKNTNFYNFYNDAANFFNDIIQDREDKNFYHFNKDNVFKIQSNVFKIYREILDNHTANEIEEILKKLETKFANDIYIQKFDKRHYQSYQSKLEKVVQSHELYLKGLDNEKKIYLEKLLGIKYNNYEKFKEIGKKIDTTINILSDVQKLDQNINNSLKSILGHSIDVQIDTSDLNNISTSQEYSQLVSLKEYFGVKDGPKNKIRDLEILNLVYSKIINNNIYYCSRNEFDEYLENKRKRIVVEYDNLGKKIIKDDIYGGNGFQKCTYVELHNKTYDFLNKIKNIKNNVIYDLKNININDIILDSRKYYSLIQNIINETKYLDDYRNNFSLFLWDIHSKSKNIDNLRIILQCITNINNPGNFDINNYYINDLPVSLFNHLEDKLKINKKKLDDLQKKYQSDYIFNDKNKGAFFKNFLILKYLIDQNDQNEILKNIYCYYINKYRPEITSNLNDHISRLKLELDKLNKLEIEHESELNGKINKYNNNFKELSDTILERFRNFRQFYDNIAKINKNVEHLNQIYQDNVENIYDVSDIVQSINKTINQYDIGFGHFQGGDINGIVSQLKSNIKFILNITENLTENNDFRKHIITLVEMKTAYQDLVKKVLSLFYFIQVWILKESKEKSTFGKFFGYFLRFIRTNPYFIGQYIIDTCNYQELNNTIILLKGIFSNFEDNMFSLPEEYNQNINDILASLSLIDPFFYIQIKNMNIEIVLPQFLRDLKGKIKPESLKIYEEFKRDKIDFNMYNQKMGMLNNFFLEYLSLFYSDNDIIDSILKILDFKKYINENLIFKDFFNQTLLDTCEVLQKYKRNIIAPKNISKKHKNATLNISQNQNIDFNSIINYLKAYNYISEWKYKLGKKINSTLSQVQVKKIYDELKDKKYIDILPSDLQTAITKSNDLNDLKNILNIIDDYHNNFYNLRTKDNLVILIQMVVKDLVIDPKDIFKEIKNNPYDQENINRILENYSHFREKNIDELFGKLNKMIKNIQNNELCYYDIQYGNHTIVILTKNLDESKIPDINRSLQIIGRILAWDREILQMVDQNKDESIDDQQKLINLVNKILGSQWKKLPQEIGSKGPEQLISNIDKEVKDAFEKYLSAEIINYNYSGLDDLKKFNLVQSLKKGQKPPEILPALIYKYLKDNILGYLDIQFDEISKILKDWKNMLNIDNPLGIMDELIKIFKTESKNPLFIKFLDSKIVNPQLDQNNKFLYFGTDSTDNAVFLLKSYFGNYHMGDILAKQLEFHKMYKDTLCITMDITYPNFTSILRKLKIFTDTITNNEMIIRNIKNVTEYEEGYNSVYNNVDGLLTSFKEINKSLESQKILYKGQNEYYVKLGGMRFQYKDNNQMNSDWDQSKKFYKVISIGMLDYYLDIISNINVRMDKYTYDKMDQILQYFYKYHYIALKRLGVLFRLIIKKYKNSNAIILSSLGGLQTDFDNFNLIKDILDDYQATQMRKISLHLRINDYKAADLADPNSREYRENLTSLIFVQNPDDPKKLTIRIKNLEPYAHKESEPLEFRFKGILKTIGKKGGIPFERIYDPIGFPDPSVISNYMSLASLLKYGKGIMIFTYGYSGVGKTATIFGALDKDGKSVPGLLQSTLSQFSEDNFQLYFRCYEIYGLGVPYNYYWNPEVSASGERPFLTSMLIHHCFQRRNDGLKNIEQKYTYSRYRILNYLLKLKNPEKSHDEWIKGEVYQKIETAELTDFKSFIEREIEAKREDPLKIEHLPKTNNNFGFDIKRIKATYNNDKSSRSVVVYEFQIKIDDQYTPFVIFDFPGKEEIKRTYVLSRPEDINNSDPKMQKRMKATLSDLDNDEYRFKKSTFVMNPIMIPYLDIYCYNNIKEIFEKNDKKIEKENDIMTDIKNMNLKFVNYDNINKFYNKFYPVNKLYQNQNLKILDLFINDKNILDKINNIGPFNYIADYIIASNKGYKTNYNICFGQLVSALVAEIIKFNMFDILIEIIHNCTQWEKENILSFLEAYYINENIGDTIYYLSNSLLKSNTSNIQINQKESEIDSINQSDLFLYYAIFRGLTLNKDLPIKVREDWLKGNNPYETQNIENIANRLGLVKDKSIIQKDEEELNVYGPKFEYLGYLQNIHHYENGIYRDENPSIQDFIDVYKPKIDHYYMLYVVTNVDKVHKGVEQVKMMEDNILLIQNILDYQTKEQKPTRIHQVHQVRQVHQVPVQPSQPQRQLQATKQPQLQTATEQPIGGSFNCFHTPLVSNKISDDDLNIIRSKIQNLEGKPNEGIKNSHNTCWVISVIQLIYQVKELRELFTNLSYTKYSFIKNFITELDSDNRSSGFSSNNEEDYKKFLEDFNKNIKYNAEYDAQEFLNEILTYLLENIKGNIKGNNYNYQPYYLGFYKLNSAYQINHNLGFNSFEILFSEKDIDTDIATTIKKRLDHINKDTIYLNIPKYLFVAVQPIRNEYDKNNPYPFITNSDFNQLLQSFAKNIDLFKKINEDLSYRRKTMNHINYLFKIKLFNYETPAIYFLKGIILYKPGHYRTMIIHTWFKGNKIKYNYTLYDAENITTYNKSFSRLDYFPLEDILNNNNIKDDFPYILLYQEIDNPEIHFRYLFPNYFAPSTTIQNRDIFRYYVNSSDKNTQCAINNKYYELDRATCIFCNNRIDKRYFKNNNNITINTNIKLNEIKNIPKYDKDKVKLDDQNPNVSDNIINILTAYDMNLPSISDISESIKKLYRKSENDQKDIEHNIALYFKDIYNKLIENQFITQNNQNIDIIAHQLSIQPNKLIYVQQITENKDNFVFYSGQQNVTSMGQKLENYFTINYDDLETMNEFFEAFKGNYKYTYAKTSEFIVLLVHSNLSINYIFQITLDSKLYNYYLIAVIDLPRKIKLITYNNTQIKMQDYEHKNNAWTLLSDQDVSRQNNVYKIKYSSLLIYRKVQIN